MSKLLHTHIPPEQKQQTTIYELLCFFFKLFKQFFRFLNAQFLWIDKTF